MEGQPAASAHRPCGRLSRRCTRVHVARKRVSDWGCQARQHFDLLAVRRMPFLPFFVATTNRAYRLRFLDASAITARFSDFLTEREMRDLLHRRNNVLLYLDRLVESQVCDDKRASCAHQYACFYTAHRATLRRSSSARPSCSRLQCTLRKSRQEHDLQPDPSYQSIIP